MYEVFSDRARAIMVRGGDLEARRRNQCPIGTEHLLLCLISEDSGGAVNMLKSLGVDVPLLRSNADKATGHGTEPVDCAGRLPKTPQSHEVIAYAHQEARGLNHKGIGTEHILLGLLCEPDGIAADVLRAQGVDLESARRVLAQQFSENPEFD